MVAKYKIKNGKGSFKFGGPVLVHRLHMRKSGPGYILYYVHIVRLGGPRVSIATAYLQPDLIIPQIVFDIGVVPRSLSHLTNNMYIQYS